MTPQEINIAINLLNTAIILIGGIAIIRKIKKLK